MLLRGPVVSALKPPSFVNSNLSNPGVRAAESPRQASKDNNALLMQRMEDSNVGPLWWFTQMQIKVRNGISIKMLKMKDRTDYVYENTGGGDKVSGERSGLLQENAAITR